MKSYESAPTGTIQRARQLRRDATAAEKLLWRKLREAFPGAKFRRQTPVGPFIADFLSFRHQIIVEVDGGQHALHTQADARRTAFLKAQGFRVLRFWNNEVLENANGVLQVVAEVLRPHPDPLPQGEGAKASSSPLPSGEGGARREAAGG